MTLEKLIKIFKLFVDGGYIDDFYQNPHGVIKSFGFGDYFKVDTKQALKYPLMYVTPKLSSFNNNSLELNFDIMFCDILDSSEANLLESLSDSLENIKDFISYFSTFTGFYNNVSDDLYDIRIDENNVRVEPFVHLLDNEVAGYFLNVTFILPFSSLYCDIPNKF